MLPVARDAWAWVLATLTGASAQMTSLSLPCTCYCEVALGSEGSGGHTALPPSPPLPELNQSFLVFLGTGACACYKARQERQGPWPAHGQVGGQTQQHHTPGGEQLWVLPCLLGSPGSGSLASGAGRALLCIRGRAPRAWLPAHTVNTHGRLGLGATSQLAPRATQSRARPSVHSAEVATASLTQREVSFTVCSLT